MNSHWLSWGLLVITYATIGQLLHSSEAGPLIWGAILVVVAVMAAISTLVWPPIRKFVLLGFQSDAGYSIMVLVLASLAVLAVVQFRAFAYAIVQIATSLLVRVDCLVAGMSDLGSFLILLLLPLLGLGLSWIPYLVLDLVGGGG